MKKNERKNVMKLSNDSRCALITLLVNIILAGLIYVGWSVWEIYFKEDYLRAQKIKEAAKRPKFERPKPTPEQIAAFKKRMEEFKKMRENELKLRADLVALLKKNNAPVCKIASAECDLALAKARQMRRRRPQVSGVDYVIKSYYSAKYAPAKVDPANEENLRLAIADIDLKNQSGSVRYFFKDEDFKHCAEEWKKNPTDENLRALCEAEKNVEPPAPRKGRGGRK